MGILLTIIQLKYYRPQQQEVIFVLITIIGVSLFELKNLAAGNVLNHSAFKSIAEHAEGVDVHQLEKNMEKVSLCLK